MNSRNSEPVGKPPVESTTRTPPVPGPAVTEPNPAPPAVAAEQHTGWLVLTRGRTPPAGTRFALTGHSTSVGRYRDCDIVLDDATVSRRHATIDRHGRNYLLADAGSLNGTYVNRSPVDSAQLTEGDEIWIGVFRLTFHAP